MRDEDGIVAEGLATASGLRLFRFRNGEPARGTVVLAHGMFSDHRVVRRLAVHLARTGHDAFCFDFRGHGESVRAPSATDFETLCLEDVHEVLDAVERHAPGSRVTWVGHSGGGLAILMYLARHSARRSRVRRVVTLASQATDAGIGFGNRAKVLSVLLGMTVVRRASGRYFGIGPESETHAVMRQWCLWNLRGRWVGRDGFDYLDALSGVHVPTLSLAGDADRFIAPPSGCRRIHAALGTTGKRYVLCGPETGFAERYGHAGIVCSRASSRDVWPLVADWIARSD